MGASSSRIQFYILGGEANSRMSMGATQSTDLLRHFDASSAECFKPEDRSHLLGVIESSYGDLHMFNHVVQSLFAAGRKSMRIGLSGRFFGGGSTGTDAGTATV